MDIVTQGLLGGVLARSVAHDDEKKPAAWAGLFAGLIADADILIRSTQDPLLNIEYHRHFTHSLVFIPIGAAIACLLLWPVLRHSLPVRRLFVFCLLGYSLSGLLDALTAYGTMLFWPFSENRIALNLISVVDPVFTFILLAGFLFGLYLPGRRIASLTLLLCLFYVSFAWFQQQRAEQLMAELAVARGHHPQRHIVKPTLGNLVLWRSVYINEGRIHVDAVHVGLPGSTLIYPGDSVPHFKLHEVFPALDEQDTLYRDLKRFTIFSDGYVAYYPQRHLVGDARYSMVPNSVDPLWGVVVEADQPEKHVDYRFFRDSSQTVRARFIKMLLGRCPPERC